MTERTPSGTASAAIGAAAAGRSRRVLVLRRGTLQAPADRRWLRGWLIAAGAVGLLLVGTSAGHRLATLLAPEPAPLSETSGTLTERVRGGLYTLELAMPAGQARWMLEFDAEIVTREGPDNPLALRDALEKLVIAASSMPIVQMSEVPDEMMRATILAIAAQDYPWLVDIHMTRSDIRATSGSKLQAMGEALRAE